MRCRSICGGLDIGQAAISVAATSPQLSRTKKPRRSEAKVALIHATTKGCTKAIYTHRLVRGIKIRREKAEAMEGLSIGRSRHALLASRSQFIMSAA